MNLESEQAKTRCSIELEVKYSTQKIVCFHDIIKEFTLSAAKCNGVSLFPYFFFGFLVSNFIIIDLYMDRRPKLAAK